MLLVPQQGRVRLMTEMGVVEAAPNEIAVIPRGVKFRAELPDGPSRGYVCENYGAPLRLPDLGPIGSNGLARYEISQKLKNKGLKSVNPLSNKYLLYL